MSGLYLVSGRLLVSLFSIPLARSYVLGDGGWVFCPVSGEVPPHSLGLGLDPLRLSRLLAPGLDPLEQGGAQNQAPTQQRPDCPNFALSSLLRVPTITLFTLIG